MEKTCIKCQKLKKYEEFRISSGYDRNGDKKRMTVCKECFNNTLCVKCNLKSFGAKTCYRCGNIKNPKRKRNKLATKQAWLKQCLRSTKLGSNVRNRPVKENDLTLEFLHELWDKQNGRCAVTGLVLLTMSTNICSASIDRVDPDIGYLQSNVILTCQWVNMGRNRTSIEDFKKILNDYTNQSLLPKPF